MNIYETHPVVAILTQLVLTAMLVCYIISFLGGWWSLSRRYGTSRPLPAGAFTGSGSFRYLAGYQNIIRLGSDSEGVYLRFWPRLAHPPLFIPWEEVTVKPSWRFIIRQQTLVLGEQTRVPLTVREKDAKKLLAKVCDPAHMPRSLEKS
jgi:hypothetical protein